MNARSTDGDANALTTTPSIQDWYFAFHVNCSDIGFKTVFFKVLVLVLDFMILVLVLILVLTLKGRENILVLRPKFLKTIATLRNVLRPCLSLW